MPEPYPNHFVSIPQSIVSLKHYFRVHDQRFARTAVYLLILAAAITAVSLALGLLRYTTEAPKTEARQAAGIEEKLADVTFQGGKASSKAGQPAILWEDFEPLGARDQRPAGKGEDAPPARLRTMLVVLDTTGKVASWDQAAAFAGCPQPKRTIVLGRTGVRTTDAEKPEAPQGGCGGPAGQPAPEPYTKEKTEELRKLIEEDGGKMPDFVLENGQAEFKPNPAKAHLLASLPVPRAIRAALLLAEVNKVELVHASSELMVIVDGTGRGLSVDHARWVVEQAEPSRRVPEFLALISAPEASLKALYEPAPRTLDFEGRSDLTAAGVARWLAATAREARHDIIARGLLPNAFKMLFYLAFEVVIIALICSVAGLIVSAFLRAGLPFTALLTMAVYAMTPARLVLPVVVDLAGLHEAWVAALPFVVGMSYTALATYRTARELGIAAAPASAPAPKL